METLSMNTLLVAAALGIVLSACAEQPEPPGRGPSAPTLPAGTYEVQSAGYEDVTGTYSILVLGAPAGHRALYRGADVRMARITDEALAAGKASHLTVDDGQAPTLYLTPDFQLSYTHSVVEPSAGSLAEGQTPVIVRQETSSWSPFASAMAGAAVANMLFAPRYYFPPPYAAGALRGYGSAGESKDLAKQQYSQKFGREPQSGRLSRTGDINRAPRADSLRSSGKGSGSSRLGKGEASPPRKPLRTFGGGRRR